MKTKILSMFLALMFILAACSPALQATAPTTVPPQPSQVPTKAVVTALQEVKLDAADYSYTAPAKIDAGWVRVTLTNSGMEPHHVQFLRLNDGVTASQFEAALSLDAGPALAMTSEVGGVGAVYPGGEASAVINLPAGEYVILCFIPSPSDGIGHHAKGMMMRITVHAGENLAAEPKADLSIRLKDFSFDMPASLPAGKLTVKVTNDGPESHELNIMKLEEGKSAQDVLAFLNGEAGGPPPFAPVGGMNGLSVGFTGYAELDLAPGTYVAICNIHSPNVEGHPHFMLGMIKEFTVGSQASANFPTGKFIKAGGAMNYGLNFKADGTFTVFEGESTLVRGTYRIDGNTFTETSNTGGCKTNVDFIYTLVGTNLTFKYSGDPSDDIACDGRYKDFNNVTYLMSK